MAVGAMLGCTAVSGTGKSVNGAWWDICDQNPYAVGCNDGGGDSGGSGNGSGIQWSGWSGPGRYEEGYQVSLPTRNSGKLRNGGEISLP